MKYAWIFLFRAAWPITLICEVLNVRVSGYFEHQRRLARALPPRQRAEVARGAVRSLRGLLPLASAAPTGTAGHRQAEMARTLRSTVPSLASSTRTRGFLGRRHRTSVAFKGRWPREERRWCATRAKVRMTTRRRSAHLGLPPRSPPCEISDIAKPKVAFRLASVADSLRASSRHRWRCPRRSIRSSCCTIWIMCETTSGLADQIVRSPARQYDTLNVGLSSGLVVRRS